MRPAAFSTQGVYQAGDVLLDIMKGGSGGVQRRGSAAVMCGVGGASPKNTNAMSDGRLAGGLLPVRIRDGCQAARCSAERMMVFLQRCQAG